MEKVRLEGHRDQLLDFVCGQPQGLGLDLDVRRGEFRKDVNRGARQLADAEQQRRHGHPQDDEPEPEAPANDRTHSPSLRRRCHVPPCPLGLERARPDR